MKAKLKLDLGFFKAGAGLNLKKPLKKTSKKVKKQMKGGLL